MNWFKFKADENNSGFCPVNLEQSASKTSWAFQTQGLFWSSPIVDEKENVYIGSSEGFFYALNREGSLLWKYKIKEGPDSLIDSAGVLLGNKIVIPGGDGYLHCLDKRTGKRLWIFKAHHSSEKNHLEGSCVNSFEGNIAGYNGLIYAGSDNGYLYALNYEGQEQWSFKTGMMVWSAPVFDKKEGWLAFGSLDKHLYLLDSKTGKLLTKKKLDGEVKSSPCFDSANRLLFTATSKGTFYCFKVENNQLELLWKRKIKCEIYSSPSFYESRVVFGASNGWFYCFSFQGKLLWKFKADSAILSSPLISQDKKVIFGTSAGALCCLELDTGHLIWKCQLSNDSLRSNLDSSPALSSSGLIYIASYNGKIYCLSFQRAKELAGFLKERAETGLKIEGDNNLSSLYSPVSFKLEGSDNRISPFSIKLSVEPKLNCRFYTSSDGQYIYLVPLEAWQPDRIYHISLSCRHFKHSGWFYNQFKQFSGHILKEKFEIKTPSLTQNNPIKDKKMLIHSLCLFSCRELNSYIAAALFSQKFIVEMFDFEQGRFKALIYQESSKDKQNRSGTLQGRFSGDHFQIKGDMEISAMGATILLKNLYTAGRFSSKEKNTLLFQAPLLKIKGNKQKFYFPGNVLSQIIDYRLKIIGSLQYQMNPNVE